MMPDLARWIDQEIEDLRKDIDRLINRMWSSLGIPASADEGLPNFAAEMHESGEILTIEIELPDAEPEDIDVSVTSDCVRISAKIPRKNTEAADAVPKKGTGLHSFSKSFRLPYRIDIDRVKAVFKKNTLTIKVPKLLLKRSCRVKVEHI